jgi:integrase
MIQNNFVKRWGAKPIADITDEDGKAAIRAIVSRGTPGMAHNSFSALRSLFSWAIRTGDFGIKVSPCAAVFPDDLIGKREPRERILTDDELRAVWNSADALGYPSGGIVKLLILTGQRLREIGNLGWQEVDLDKRVIIIPSSRMKNKRAHAIPLAPMALELLKSLPHFKASHVFTTTSGAKPFTGFFKAKQRLDQLSGVSGWVFHDIRRTVRTRWGDLPTVQDHIRELAISHTPSSMHRIYHQNTHYDAKLELFTLWEQRLASLVAPALPPRTTGACGVLPLVVCLWA